MEAVRIETIVQPNGIVVLENLPFDEGEHVEVIVLEKNEENTKKPEFDEPYPLRGTSYQYEDPFSPLISLEQWEPFKS